MTKPRPSQVTLHDVGSAVGVSAKTVSNVIRGQGWVSDSVRQRVREAIDELGYRPNIAARQLRTGKSGIISLVVPNLRETYFAEYAGSFIAAARERGLTVLVSQTDGDRLREIEAIEGHGLPGLDAIVLSPLTLTTDDLSQRRSEAPLVLIGEYGETLFKGQTSHVSINNVEAAKAATKSLIAAGRKRIAVVGVQEDPTKATSATRFEGYKAALEDADIPFDPDLVAPVEWFNRAEASAAVSKLLDNNVQFDGIFCFNDAMAFGALYTLGVAEIDVPGDVLVMGFDNTEEGRFHLPRFSTVDPGADFASKAILDLIESGNQEPTHVEVDFKIIDR